jgi:CheY-like chemotaxis protein
VVDAVDAKRPQLSNGSCGRVFVGDPAAHELAVHHSVRSVGENCDSRGHTDVNKVGGFELKPTVVLSRFRLLQVLVVKTAPREQSHNYRCEADVSPMRVLVAEDFAPFWQVIRSTLAERPGVQIIGEVADGLEAVQKAVLLEPDLVLLDIGLPTLNGIEAARQIRKLAPASKIIFVTQESTSEVVQEALKLGAWGYVVKARAASDLLAAVDAFLEGRQFVSVELAIQNFN